MNPSSPYGLILSFLALSMAATNQSYAQTSGRSEIFAGSELETYIRLLQIGGKAALYPWSDSNPGSQLVSPNPFARSLRHG